MMAPNPETNTTASPRPSGAWLRLQAAMPESARVATLSSDAARWAFTATLCAAKKQDRSGAWANEQHYRACVTRSVARHLPELLEVGLVEEAPNLCPDCVKEWHELEPGWLVVHGWRHYQLDPTGAARQQAARARKREVASLEVTAPSRDGHDPITEESRRDGDADVHVDYDCPSPGATPFTDLHVVLDWLATHGQGEPIRAGDRLYREVARFVAKHGAVRVVEAMKQLAERDQTTLRQLVFGADRLLNPIASPRPSARVRNSRGQYSYDEAVAAR